MIFTEEDGVELVMPESLSSARDGEDRDGNLTPLKRPSDTFYNVSSTYSSCVDLTQRRSEYAFVTATGTRRFRHQWRQLSR